MFLWPISERRVDCISARPDAGRVRQEEKGNTEDGRKDGITTLMDVSLRSVEDRTDRRL